MDYRVSLAKCRSYEPDLVNSAVRECLAPFGSLRTFVKNGDRVLIKVNLLRSVPPARAVTTHPLMVKAVVEEVQAIGAVPIIGDSPGGRNTPASYAALLKKTGMQWVADETGCEVAFFDGETVEYSAEEGRTFRKFTVPRAVLDADLVIGLPKLKTHQLTLMTGAVKLQYGYLPGLTKAEYHLNAGRSIDRFAELLLDLYLTLPPAFYIMDAIIGMEGNGPSHGEPKDIGLIIAAISATALDYVAARIIGFDPMVIPTVKLACARGTGPCGIDEISIHGGKIEELAVNDFEKPGTMFAMRIPACLLDVASRFLGARPVIDPETCTLCGTCAAHCPSHAIIHAKGAIPRIRYRMCIRCFCCQELCPAGAVSIWRPRLRRWAGS
jgi:uncharacterized protein (DUF362 family)/Pyruvate/2-oxoacid:ferredoxin oxidoreductase delta subunit